MKCIALSASFFVLFFSTMLCAVENYEYYIDAQSINGYTGNILTPSAKVISHKVWSVGLHRFMVGINYGLLPHLETGIFFDLKEMSPLFPLDQDNINRKSKEITFHSKYHLLREAEHPFGLAIGQHRESYYLVAGKELPSLWETTFQGGILWERATLNSFFSINQTTPSRQVIFDYEPEKERYNLGWRFLLSPEIKLDFFIMDITRIKNIFFNNFIFGLTLIG